LAQPKTKSDTPSVRKREQQRMADSRNKKSPRFANAKAVSHSHRANRNGSAVVRLWQLKSRVSTDNSPF
jgi:hypothetical protein